MKRSNDECKKRTEHIYTTWPSKELGEIEVKSWMLKSLTTWLLGSNHAIYRALNICKQRDEDMNMVVVLIRSPRHVGAPLAGPARLVTTGVGSWMHVKGRRESYALMLRSGLIGPNLVVPRS